MKLIALFLALAINSIAGPVLTQPPISGYSAAAAGDVRATTLAVSGTSGFTGAVNVIGQVVSQSGFVAKSGATLKGVYYNDGLGLASDLPLLFRDNTDASAGAWDVSIARVGVGTVTLSTTGTSANGTLLTGTIATTGTAMHITTGTLGNGVAAQVGTMTNAPTAGNPTKWIPIIDSGTTRYIPAW